MDNKHFFSFLSPRVFFFLSSDKKKLCFLITRRLFHFIDCQYQMRQKPYIKFLIGICIFVCCKYISNYNEQRRITISRLERLHNYNQTLNNDKILDTYYHRILRFLNERNISISSYEQANTTNDILQRGMLIKVHYLHNCLHH
jgi:hypothetical protein